MQMSEYDRARAALAYIPNHERETWVRMGMAIKAEFGEGGFDAWDEWSHGAETYNTADARAVWKSISEGGAITIASLYHEAKQNGWKPNGSGPVPAPSLEELAAREARIKAEREREEREAAEAKSKARNLWKAAKPAPSDHPYLVAKGIAPTETLRCISVKDAGQILGYAPKCSDAVLVGSLLVAPLKCGEDFVSAELIDADGRKAVPYGSKVSGAYWAAQPMPEHDGEGTTIAIGEGVATVLSVREATGCYAVAARSCGNLRPVAEAMRRRYPRARIVILADVGNGEDKARQAAAATADAVLAVPDFGPERPANAKDFNDVHKLLGVETVRKALGAAQRIESVPEAQPTTENRSKGDSGGPAPTPDAWGEPEPMIPAREPDPYPLDAWPGKIGAAIREVLAFTQTPPALVAHSALAALSIAGQGLANVRRGEGLEGPISLYALILCESGERKSAVDKLLIGPIKEWEREARENDRQRWAEYLSNRDAWEQEREGIKLAIREAKRKGRKAAESGDAALDLEGLRQELKEHDAKRPIAPLSRLGFVIEPTQPKLLECFAERSRCLALVADEGGTILGGHGMRADNAVGMFSTLNKAWDGDTIGSERSTVDSHITDNPRFTLAVAVQPDVMEAFRENTGNLARGSGLQARALFAFPQTTQGQRPYREATPELPALGAFVARLRELLATPLTYDGPVTRSLQPPVLSFTAEGKAAWVQFHDDAERELGDGGELADAKDVASKAAENVARLAALLHVFEQGPAGEISAAHVEAAARIVTWHLYQAQSYFTGIAPTPEIIGAEKLEAWLVRRFHEKGEKQTKAQTILQYGPGALRHRETLDPALAELMRRKRARKVKGDKGAECVELNPALLGGNHAAA